MKREEIVLGGFGGQGIILAGSIVGKAAAIFNGENATLTQDYGPEARGGACRAQVVVSDGPISYPYVDNPAVLVVMSQEAYEKYSAGLKPEVPLLIDEDLVKLKKTKKHKVYAIPSTRFARELGREAVANIVMVGFLAAVSNIVPSEAMKQSVLDSVPKGTEELNTKAFERGYNYGRELAGKR
ncbi:MAG: 2-oxoacid:acceptor oxidoreductase family protein [Dehalococcoidales bacterium]|nr:2-oxoacid:acceptor oxidoreductase family protein [Dehalococcoidales bacterium]